MWPPGCSSTRPEAAARAHVACGANLALESAGDLREAQSAKREFPGSPGMQTGLPRRVLLYGFWVSRPRGNRDRTRQIARTACSLAQYILDRKSAACDSEKHCQLTAWRAVAAVVGGRKN